jgi:hypothetical protein
MRLYPPSILLVTLLTAASLHAQATNPRPVPNSVWLRPGNHSDYGNVEVITIARPGVRRPCRVHEVTAHSIVCGIGVARKPLVLQSDEVAAVLYPRDHSGENIFFICTAAAVAGTIAAAIFLPPLAAVAIGIPSIWLALSTAMLTDGDSDAESILYQRPNTPLTLHLHA